MLAGKLFVAPYLWEHTLRHPIHLQPSSPAAWVRGVIAFMTGEGWHVCWRVTVTFQGSVCLPRIALESVYLLLVPDDLKIKETGWKSQLESWLSSCPLPADSSAALSNFRGRWTFCLGSRPSSGLGMVLFPRTPGLPWWTGGSALPFSFASFRLFSSPLQAPSFLTSLSPLSELLRT